MPANTTTAPTFTIIGDDAQASDGAIAALSRLLLAAADGESQTPNHDTPPIAASVAVFPFQPQKKDK